jgi:hypothetical protein
VMGFSAQCWVELRRFAFLPQGSLSWWVISGIGLQEESNLWWVSPVPCADSIFAPYGWSCPFRTSVGCTQILLLSPLVWNDWVTFPADWYSLWICIQESLQLVFLPRGLVKRPSCGIKTHQRMRTVCLGSCRKVFQTAFYWALCDQQRRIKVYYNHCLIKWNHRIMRRQ